MQFQNETIRELARASIGGRSLRIELSNLYGIETLNINAAHIAVSSSGSSIVPGSDRVLTFGGSRFCSIPPGAAVISDLVIADFSPAANLAVSLYLADPSSSPTVHPIALETNYTVLGNHVGDIDLVATSTITSTPFLSRIEVVDAGEGSASIVALGDSITDGFDSTLGVNHRWTDILSNRLNASSEIPRGVLNAALSGNRLLHDAPAGYAWYGPAALNRFNRDVLSQPGIKYIIVFEGINDIGLPGYVAPESEQVTAAQIIAGLRELIQQAHSNGLKIYGGTLAPFEDAAYPGYYSPEKEAERAEVNQWIRASKSFDAVIDFDQVLRDPNQPTKLLPLYDSGDHLHPNDAGYAAMGNAIDLTLF